MNKANFVKINIGGKQQGIADQASIDLEIGCRNKCVGCYGSKASRRGGQFYSDIISKEYNDDIFRASCKAAKKKGIKYVRFGKFSDPGDPAVRRDAIKILEAATKENLRVVFVTKSLEYNKEFAEVLKSGNHILHVSLGMITKAPLNYIRKDVGSKYHAVGVNSYWRITDDVTARMPSEYQDLPGDRIILTPIRFASMEQLNEYKANKELYRWTGGYYKPININTSWLCSSDHMCGEIGGKSYCSNCLVGE